MSRRSVYFLVFVLVFVIIAAAIGILSGPPHFQDCDCIECNPDSVLDDPGGSIKTTPLIPGPEFDDFENFVLLARLDEPDSSKPAQSPQLPERSYFRSTAGEFRDVSSLTAWDNNAQVLIGPSDGAAGTPILFDSSSLTLNNWLSAKVTSIFNASGFRIAFSTLGFENIRFSATQTVSGDFGDGAESEVPFELAFSTSGGVRWTSVHESGAIVNTGQTTQTYDKISIPGVIDNEDEVLLRVYLNTPSNVQAKGSISINNIRIIGDEIGTGATDVVLMVLGENDANVASLFSATPEDAFYGATSGLPDSDFRLTGWDSSRPRFIGYTGTLQAPVVFENVMTVRNWTAADGDIARATAFQIQIRTLGYEDILFSADQISSRGGPDIFKLAYSLDGETWIPIADSSRSIQQSSDNSYDSLALSYDRFLLPPETSSRECVFLRVYFDGTATGESTSINNIELWGRAITPGDGFTAQMLTISPGALSSERNITWHDWKTVGLTGTVMFEPAQTASGGFTDAAQSAVAVSTDAYIRTVSHMATISGLEPDTEYVYAVSSDGVNFSELYTFKTSPVSSFTFVAVSDIHMGDPSVSPEDDDSGNSGLCDIRYRPGVTVRQSWKDALDTITGTVPHISLIAMMGDVIDRNLINSELESEFHPHRIKWENFFAPKQLGSIAFAPVMGNHEARSNISFRAHFNVPNEIVPTAENMLPMASTGIQQENENRANYWYLYNNALFVVLNTSTRPRDAGENAAQDAIIQGLIAHFDDVLEAAKAAHKGEYDWLFVQTHKSVNGLAKHSADFDVERYVRFGFEALMAKHEVDIVFSAHEHCYTRSFPLLLNPGPDNFGPDIPRDDYRMNNVSYDFKNNGNSINQGDGTIFFTLNTISGQKFYSAYAPEFYNNVNYPYLSDGTRGAINMSLPPEDNVFLPADTQTLGPRVPWSIANYRQQYKPMFIELTVTAGSVAVTVYEFAHDQNGVLLDVTVVDTLNITR